ncbi:PLP-dependent transferase [Ensifer adhaerens]|nr:PLP-dependent transferase [Ensifer adhaerens]
MDLFGGIVTFQMRDPAAMARKLAAHLKVAHYAFSLGHQRSIVVLLDTQEMMKSAYGLTGEQLADYRRFAGDGVFRLSVGLEATDDLIADFEQAISA